MINTYEDLEEEQKQSSFQQEEMVEDETFKEEVSPNEACYIDIEPLDQGQLVPLNDSIARQRASDFKEKTKRINN